MLLLSVFLSALIGYGASDVYSSSSGISPLGEHTISGSGVFNFVSVFNSGSGSGSESISGSTGDSTSGSGNFEPSGSGSGTSSGSGSLMSGLESGSGGSVGSRNESES